MVRARSLWVLLPAVAVIDIVLQAHLASSHPGEGDIEAAASLVRSGYTEGDLVVVAPKWLAEARRALGGAVLPLVDQARPDEAVYRRLWEVSARGETSPESSGHSPELEKRFGTVAVRRYLLQPSAVVDFDFVTSIDTAVVRSVDGHDRRLYRRRGRRWVAPGARNDVWVGTETISDLDFLPRRCVWANTLPRPRRLRVEYRGIRRGRTIEGHTATDYVSGRHCASEPVRFTVFVDNRQVLAVSHHDCDGWRSFRVEVPEGSDEAVVAFEISTDDPAEHDFCFQAQMRSPP